MGVKKTLVWIDPDTGIRYDKETGRVLPEKKGSSYEVIMERKKGAKRIKPLRYQARHRKNTFLKYWRIVRYWAKAAGKNVKGKDYDHAVKRFVKTATNRGRKGEGGRVKKS